MVPRPKYIEALVFVELPGDFQSFAVVLPRRIIASPPSA
jgi:hypothetical protein